MDRRWVVKFTGATGRSEPHTPGVKFSAAGAPFCLMAQGVVK